MAQELKVHQGRNLSQSGAGGSAVQRMRAPMPLLSPFEEIDRLFDELLPMSMLRLGRSPLTRSLVGAQARMPNIDLLERDDELVLRAEVPGFRKEDLDISVDENSVTIRGAHADEQEEEGGDYYRREIAYGEFARSVTLPSAVEIDKVKAELKDGVLELVMPKQEAAKRRKVTIQ